MSTTLIIPASVSRSILKRDLLQVKKIVAESYIAHLEGHVKNPSSATVQITDHIADRGIALPAYIERKGESAIFGLKWITSRVGNGKLNLARAHGVLILSCPQTGVPLAILEASDISAFRTAASACLAAEHLHTGDRVITLGVVGCGYIAASAVAFFLASGWTVNKVLLADIVPEIAGKFEAKIKAVWPYGHLHCEQIDSPVDVVRRCDITIFATTSPTEYFQEANALSRNPIILHLSLRDLAPGVICIANNYVDDAKEATRPSTSLGKATKNYGDCIVTGTLGELLVKTIRPDPQKASIFSPYGLGMLDLALGNYVWHNAVEAEETVQIDNFY